MSGEITGAIFAGAEVTRVGGLPLVGLLSFRPPSECLQETAKLQIFYLFGT